ncbi:MAG: isoprenylcysteine carboxylmethyltransferase family protein [Brucellaceae bacterium]|nr:isoprenylcysteine carboxylmethyltransferase family protein [Brucellaceae bacterium]
MNEPNDHDIAHAAERPEPHPWPPIILVGAIVAGYLLNRFVLLPWCPRRFRYPVRRRAPGDRRGAGHRRRGHAHDVQGAHHHPAAPRLQRFRRRGAVPLLRNPIYVANVMIVTGLGLAFANLWYLPLAAAVAMLINAPAIPGEERHLEHKFHKHYRDYKKKVRRWI